MPKMFDLSGTLKVMTGSDIGRVVRRIVKKVEAFGEYVHEFLLYVLFLGIGALVINVGIYAYENWREPAIATFHELDRAVTDCEGLSDELEADFACRRGSNCTMTRDELLAFQERSDKYQKYCVESE